MKLFTEFLANLNKERAGDTYRPANGTEEDMFFGEECRRCIHQTNYGENHICETEWESSINQKEDDDYPSELQYGNDGQPCCRRKTVLPAAIFPKKTTNPLAAVIRLILARFDSDKIAAANLAINGFGAIKKGNAAYDELLAAQLITDDGSPIDKDELTNGLISEVNKRVSDGTFY